MLFKPELISFVSFKDYIHEEINESSQALRLLDFEMISQSFDPATPV